MTEQKEVVEAVVVAVEDNNDNNNDNDRGVEITDLLTDCAAHHLNVSTDPFLCLAGNNFDLHDAMSASQLMDPIMDCCEIPAALVAPWKQQQKNNNNNNNNNDHDDDDDDDEARRMVFPRPVPTGLDDPMTPLPWKTLTVTDAAHVALEIMVRLQSLLCGASVAESTFTCLYAQNTVLTDMQSRLMGSISTTTTTIHETSLSHQFKDLSVSKQQESTTKSSTATLAAAQWGVFASALALVEITEVVRNIILNADIYEEEDFATNTHSIIFYTTENTTTINASNIHNSNSSKKKNGPSNNNNQKNRIDTAETIRTALREIQNYSETQLQGADTVAAAAAATSVLELVLKFQLQFLAACSLLSRLKHASLIKNVFQAQPTVRQAVSTLRELQTSTDEFLGGSSSDDNQEEEYAAPVQSLLQKTFDSFVNRPLVGNLPIRKISFQRPHKAISVLSVITNELDTAVCNLLLCGTSLGRIQRMLDRICQSDINILSRSLIVLNLYFDEQLLGQYNLQELVNDHLQQWQAPAVEHNSKTSPWVVSDHTRSFLDRLAKPIYDCLKLRILNRNRQRAYIEVVMLPEWISLQNEAQLVDLQCYQQYQMATGALGTDSGPPATYFFRYVLSILIRLMDRFIESGIEVGLFHNSHHDLSFAYWYRDFLLSALSQNLTVMKQAREVAASNALQQQQQQAASTTHKGKGKKKHKNKIAVNGKHGGRNEILSPPPTAEDLEDSLELRMIAVKRNMCRKSIQFLAALSQAGILKEQRFEFTSLQRIFEKRFEVFEGIHQPPPLSYMHYLEGNDYSQIPPSDLIQTVTEGFQYCRTMIEQILQETTSGPKKIDPVYASAAESELRALIKVCIGNSVYVQKLRQLVESGETIAAKVSFDFESQRQFCIFKITS